jgi:hypothetical protein
MASVDWPPAVSACGYCLHEVEALWASALPCYEACVHAMSSITRMDLKEVASFQKPPQLLVPVCDCVLLLLGLKPGFDAFSQLFRRSDGIQLLLQYDKDNIPPKVLKAVAAYIVSMPSPDAMERVSKAGVSLVRWCQGAQRSAVAASPPSLSFAIPVQECFNTRNSPVASIMSDPRHSSANTCPSPRCQPPAASPPRPRASCSTPAIRSSTAFTI